MYLFIPKIGTEVKSTPSWGLKGEVMTGDIIAQVWIVCFGCSAVWLVGRLEKWKRWGYILGLCGQPA
jgi:hypothetical protein